MTPKNTICIWYDREAEEAANFYSSVFPDSAVTEVIRSPMDNPGNKAGDVMVVLFTVCGILKCSYKDYTIESIPLFIAVLAVVVIMILFPEIVMFLPDAMMG